MRGGCILTAREMVGAGRHNISGRPDPDGSGSWEDHGVAPASMRARPKMVGLRRGGVSRWGIRKCDASFMSNVDPGRRGAD